MRYLLWLSAAVFYYVFKIARLAAMSAGRKRLPVSTTRLLPQRARLSPHPSVALCAIGIGLSSLLTSCDTNRVFESNTDLVESSWAKDHLISFGFEINDAQLPYNIYTNIRNASAYPFHNLYYKYTLQDSTGTVLAEQQQYIDLFDPKTGEPYGSGLGDLFDHRQLILESYKFPAPGLYTLTFQHYMRKDSLPFILSVGARVEWADEE